MSIRTIIADKDNRINACIRQYLKAHSDIEIIDECNNGKDLLDKIIKFKPDLIITEVNLPFKDGLEVMQQCYKLCKDVNFIFIADSEEYALTALELEAIDYLMKPIRNFRLSKSIIKAKQIIKKQKENQAFHSINNLPVKYSKGMYYIKKEEIYFIEKIDKKCVIYTTRDVFETRENIGELLHQLNGSFCLSHRSYIINLEKVTEISPYKETYIASFNGVNRQAKISKLKIDEVKKRVLMFL
ncbi:LytR/AlgR family response regulator transcription factor [Niallia circulans]|uniref:Response regulator transcription factor n=1 Tax=Niallia circulans TaxID=1397 RepID=A0A941GJK5_NIACI|nr:LytTR family DNA-binding domain-containing protein [Niallia circulans]MCB5237310.1 LytTR family DNA-binding domain-containing protein [Niallia circulans]